jgi:peptide chain release factor 1
VTGKGAAAAFADEAGGHRWQRIPPNEPRGRVHTSTITVAVLAAPDEHELAIDPADVVVRRSRGSGAGGQHRNKTESAVDLTHVPTGTVVHCESERSLHRNLAIARARLRAQLAQAARRDATDARDATRREQVGSGMRGDKRRTIRAQEGTVVDHPTGRAWRLRDYLRGDY